MGDKLKNTSKINLQSSIGLNYFNLVLSVNIHITYKF